MKIIAKGGGMAGVTRIKLSSGMNKKLFMQRIDNGEEIWNKLMYSATPSFSWEDEDGEFMWAVEETGLDLVW